MTLPKMHVERAVQQPIYIGGYQLTQTLDRTDNAERFYAQAKDGSEVELTLYELGSNQDGLREINFLKRLIHPNVGRLLAHGTFGGRIYTVHERLPGVRLSELINAPVGWRLAFTWVRSLCRALAVLEQARVSHCNIRPESLVVANEGDTTWLVGFSHATAWSRRSMTRACPPDYSAPEQHRVHSGGPQIDLYSTGALLFRLVTGQSVFSGATRDELLAQHIASPVPLPSHRRRDLSIPSAVDDLCLWLLEKDPERRLPTSAVLRLVVDEILEGPQASMQRDRHTLL